MAWNKPIRTSVYVKAYTGKRTRIRIAQPVERPLALRSKDLIRKDLLRSNKWWGVTHRRGPRRPKLGGDPREARAISKDDVKGTLPERIVYKYLTHNLHLRSDYDFDFQSSQSGGRLELGGIVADFMFPILKIIIQVQGPTHTGYLRSRKDEEQRGILESMGYRVFDIEEMVCYNEARLEDWMRRVFSLSLGNGSGGGYYHSVGTSGIQSTMVSSENQEADNEPEYEDEIGMQQLLYDIIKLKEQVPVSFF